MRTTVHFKGQDAPLVVEGAAPMIDHDDHSIDLIDEAWIVLGHGPFAFEDVARVVFEPEDK